MSRADRKFILAGLASLLSQQFNIPKLAMEFGAGDGWADTITRPIICQLEGWRGLWIEPHPNTFAAMQRRVEDDELPVEALNIAVSNFNGKIPFYPCETCAGWSSTVPPRQRRNHRQRAGEYQEPVEVECQRLPKILQCRGEVGVMVCDVEEHDSVVMADMIRSPVRPAILMVESNMPVYQKQQTRLLKDDYGVVWRFPKGLDKVYVRRDLLEILS